MFLGPESAGQIHESSAVIRVDIAMQRLILNNRKIIEIYRDRERGFVKLVTKICSSGTMKRYYNDYLYMSAMIKI